MPEPDDRPGAESERTPIGFLIFVVAAVLYLGLRLVQGIGWVLDRIG